MSQRFLLDTGTISASVAPDPNRRILRKLEQHGAHCAIAAPVWHELVYGLQRLPGGKRRAVLEDYLEDVVRRSFPILPYDGVAAEWHGRERARLEREGKTPPFTDGQIAALARTQELTLVTTNVKDYRWFADLEIVDWSR